MRKLMMGLKVGLLVVGLLAMVATPAMAQFTDPLTLAASGVLIPYFGTGNNVSILEVASPVGPNFFAHMIFYNANCTRVTSFPFESTKNDLDLFLAASSAVGSIVVGVDGLVAIASEAGNGIDLVPLANPIHSRMYHINVSTSTFRVLEPIILDAYEAGGAVTWSPIRTGATFFAPVNTTPGLQTTLTLICPKNTIQGAAGAAFPSSLFPTPLFPSTSASFLSTYPTGSLLLRIYDVDEDLIIDKQIGCDCLQQTTLASIDPVYTLFDTYTEMETDGTYAGFTGYKGIRFSGNAAVDLFGRLSNGNRLSLQGIPPTAAGPPAGCAAGAAGTGCR